MTIGQSLADRSVFVTGHTGFKGSWLSIWLHDLGARVTGYALSPPTEPSNFISSGVSNLLAANHIEDTRDLSRLKTALAAAEPDVIFHLAAQPIVRMSCLNPRATLETNIMGTVNLLEAVRALEKPCVTVVITSDKCYENRNQIWGYREIDTLGGCDPYSASKAAVEIVAAAYRQSFGLRLATVRASNVIGGGDWAQDRIVPDAVRHLVAGTPIPLRCPSAFRPWQYVLEPLSGYLMLAERMLCSDNSDWCDAWNFGPMSGNDVSVGALVDLLIQVWGSGSREHTGETIHPPEAGILRLNIDKTLSQLGWRPRWTVDSAINKTAEWFRRFYTEGPGTALKTCREHIAAYEADELA